MSPAKLLKQIKFSTSSSSELTFEFNFKNIIFKLKFKRVRARKLNKKKLRTNGLTVARC